MPKLLSICLVLVVAAFIAGGLAPIWPVCYTIGNVLFILAAILGAIVCAVPLIRRLRARFARPNPPAHDDQATLPLIGCLVALLLAVTWLLRPSVNRYQIHSVDGSRMSLLLDTCTGDTWIAPDPPLVWVPCRRSSTKPASAP